MPPQKNNPQPNQINRSTLVPIGAVVSLVIILVGAWGFLDSRFTTIDRALDKQDRRLERLEEKTGDRWTSTEMKLWGAQLKNLNPDMKIPEW